MATVSERPPAILTLPSFLQINRIIFRYLEMLKMMKSESPSHSEHLCSICQDEDSKIIVLSCSHSLCEQCHSRWVSRQLSCPFCREHFQKRSVHQNQWEMLEWQPKDVIKDIVSLECQLDDIWHGLAFSATADGLLEAYSRIERMLFVQEKNGIVMVENRK